MMVETAFALCIGTLAGDTRDDPTQPGRNRADGISRLWRPRDFVFVWQVVGTPHFTGHTARRLCL